MTTAKEKSNPGFRAQFQGANLWDLVQMECMGRARGVVRVDNGREAGFLFFDGGRIVHAQTRRLIGEGAALEILAWDSGSFERCEREWPRMTTIAISYEGLLLKAAQHRDESSASNLVAFPNRSGEAEPAGAIPTATHDWEQEVTRPTLLDDPKGGPAELEMMLRLNAAGVVVRSKGADEDTAAAVAYAARLAGLVGDLMGLEGFRALESAAKTGERFVIVSESNGDVVGARASGQADLSALRERLGLA